VILVWADSICEEFDEHVTAGLIFLILCSMATSLSALELLAFDLSGGLDALLGAVVVGHL
jgi:hypothetical protein